MPHFSNASKMPCRSWGIPSRYCITGGKLRAQGKEKLTACAFCYTFTGRIALETIQRRLQENLDEYLENSRKWIERMVIGIKWHSESYFRFFHSGDLQSVEMLEDICEIARQSPDTKFWLPTQERGMVASFLKGGEIPDNLNIRISAPLVDKPEKSTLEGVTFAMISLDEVEGIECPARKYKNTCGPCRACWDKSVETVSYPLKIGKHYRPKSARKLKK